MMYLQQLTAIGHNYNLFSENSCCYHYFDQGHSSYTLIHLLSFKTLLVMK